MNIFLNRKKTFILLFIAIAGLTYLINDYYPPLVIPLQEDEVWNLSCLRAEDLIVQERDSEGHLWATRGMWAYRLNKGDKKFIRQYHIPTGLSIYWIRNFSIVRDFSNDPECVELLPLANGGATALSGGHIWYRKNSESEFEKTLSLSNYGLGIGRGITAQGFTRLESGAVIFGEYFRNPERKDVCLYSSWDGGLSWENSYKFLAGEIRHVHVAKQDPYTGNIWIGTGDRDHEANIAFSSDSLQTIEIIGTDSQIWRTLTFVFNEESMIWGTDTEREKYAGIYKWDRKTKEVTKLANTNGCIFYATKLAGGTIVLSTDREGIDLEKDDFTRLWIITDEKQVFSIPCGRWNHGKNYGTLRFSRDTGASELALSCVNHDEYNRDLLIISEDELKRAISNIETASISY